MNKAIVSFSVFLICLVGCGPKTPAHVGSIKASGLHKGNHYANYPSKYYPGAGSIHTTIRIDSDPCPAPQNRYKQGSGGIMTAVNSYRTKVGIIVPGQIVSKCAIEMSSVPRGAERYAGKVSFSFRDLKGKVYPVAIPIGGYFSRGHVYYYADPTRIEFREWSGQRGVTKIITFSPFLQTMK